MRIPVVLLSLTFWLLMINHADAGKRKPIRVGQVIIVGNTITQDRVIREALRSIEPGQILRRKEVRSAERKLAAMGLFKVDPPKKIRPTVQVLDTPGQFKDILVKVEETSTRQWKLDCAVNAVGQPIIRLMMEDPNFDPFRFPISLEDMTDGRAFRGGGQRARLDVLRLNLIQGRIELFTDGLLPTVAKAWFAEFR